MEEFNNSGNEENDKTALCIRLDRNGNAVMSWCGCHKPVPNPCGSSQFAMIKKGQGLTFDSGLLLVNGKPLEILYDGQELMFSAAGEPIHLNVEYLSVPDNLAPPEPEASFSFNFPPPADPSTYDIVDERERLLAEVMSPVPWPALNFED